MSKLGFGTTFTWDGAVIAKLTAINGIELTVDMVDATTHDSSDSYKEVVPGLIDPGEIGLEGYFDYTDTTGQHAMLADLNARDSKTYTITFPASTGTTWTGTGYLTKLKIGDAPTDGLIPFSASVKPSGKPTFAVATSTGLTNPFFTVSNSTDIIPAASGSVYEYAVTVLTGTSTVTVTPTAASGVITVDGNVVATGVASSAITLGAADSVTTITIVVTETSKAPKTYTLKVVRP